MSRREFALSVRVGIGEKLQRGIKHDMTAKYVSPVSFIRSQPFTAFLWGF